MISMIYLAVSRYFQICQDVFCSRDTLSNCFDISNILCVSLALSAPLPLPLFHVSARFNPQNRYLVYVSFFGSVCTWNANIITCYVIRQPFSPLVLIVDVYGKLSFLRPSRSLCENRKKILLTK